MGSAPYRSLSPAAAAFLVVLASACSKNDKAEPTPAAPPPAPVAQVLPPPLGRAELLQAVAAAASAYAGGEAYPESAAALAGRTFSLKLPFGCEGAMPSDMTSTSWDAQTRTLRLSIKPEVWTKVAWVKNLVGSPDTEAIEGLWVRRPWIGSETCPTATLPILPNVQPDPETVGLAQVFAKGGSRVARRDGQPYEVTRRLGDGETPGAGGYRLVLEGRIAAPADARPIRCTTNGPDRRPTCLVIVEIDKVAAQTAAGDSLSEWRR